MGGRENCACSQASIPVKDAQTERVCDTDNPRVPPRCTTRSAQISCTGSSSPKPPPPLPQCRTPVPQALVPNLLQPKPTSILFVNTPKDFQFSTPKSPTFCTPQPLMASAPHLPLPSLSHAFPPGFVPTTTPLCFSFFTLYGSISTQPDSLVLTSGPQALLGSQLFYLCCHHC